MMRKLLPAMALAALSTAAFAGSCPLLMKDIDAALADPQVEQRLGEDKFEEAQRLRKQGEEDHLTGNHDASMEKLNRAKGILGIS